jgi:hypothetical protein
MNVTHSGVHRSPNRIGLRTGPIKSFDPGLALPVSPGLLLRHLNPSEPGDAAQSLFHESSRDRDRPSCRSQLFSAITSRVMRPSFAPLGIVKQGFRGGWPRNKTAYLLKNHFYTLKIYATGAPFVNVNLHLRISHMRDCDSLDIIATVAPRTSLLASIGLVGCLH